jgi:hypothetical protein
MDVEHAAPSPECSECHRVWRPDARERWLAYLDCDDDVWLFCPACADREFGAGSDG